MLDFNEVSVVDGVSELELLGTSVVESVGVT
jgi:hypothetical protein